MPLIQTFHTDLCGHCFSQTLYVSDLVKCTGLKTQRQGQPATGRTRELISRYTNLHGTASAAAWEIMDLHSQGEGGGGEGGEGGGEDVA